MKYLFILFISACILCYGDTFSSSVDIAPQSIANKTIHFSYAQAIEIWFEYEAGDESISKDAFKLEDGDYDGGCNPISVTIPSQNNKEIKYNKIGPSTARLVIEYNHIVDFIYILSFTTPTSGTAVRIWWEGGYNVYASDIEFTIE